MKMNDVVFWSARILGIALSVFLSLFALDAFQPGQPPGRALAEFAINLAPAAVVFAIVVLSWRRAAIGGIAFVLIAAAYAMTIGFRLDWMLVISGPLLMTGLLFLWSWRTHQLEPR
jgi:hypothetical protein